MVKSESRVCANPNCEHSFWSLGTKEYYKFCSRSCQVKYYNDTHKKIKKLE